MPSKRAADSYPASYYDDHFCLKPPVLLWVAVFYLSRALTLPIVMALGHFAGVDSTAIDMGRELWSRDALVPSLIAACVLYALFRRAPSASKPVRWIWRRGQIFLAVSAGLDIALLAIPFLEQRELTDHQLISLFAMIVDLYFLIYILAARRVRHAFAEFPAPLSLSRATAG
jgi:hypothetical protein